MADRLCPVPITQLVQFLIAKNPILLTIHDNCMAKGYSKTANGSAPDFEPQLWATGKQARTVLDVLLHKYTNEGYETVESMDILRVQPLNRLDTPMELVRSFGSRKEYQQAVLELEKEL